MELRQLKTFQTVARLLSFNQAADVLNYAPSTVSAQIKLLEEEFGVLLFDRLGKRVILTEAGQTLVQYAKRMLDIEAETFTEISGWEEPCGAISIRIPQSIGTYHLPSIIEKFKARFPKVGFNISSCAYQSLPRELKEGITDLAFLLTESVQSNELVAEMLKIEPLVIVASPQHPLCALDDVRINDFAGESILLPKHDCSYKMSFEQILTREKVKSATIMEMNSIEAIKQCVKKGIGITMIPEIAVKDEISRKSLVVLPWVEESLEAAILMIWHKDKWISPTLKVFMDTARELIKP